MDKENLLEVIKNNKRLFESFVHVMEFDIEDLKNQLCEQQNPEVIKRLQGQIYQIKQYLKILK